MTNTTETTQWTHKEARRRAEEALAEYGWTLHLQWSGGRIAEFTHPRGGSLHLERTKGGAVRWKYGTREGLVYGDVTLNEFRSLLVAATPTFPALLLVTLTDEALDAAYRAARRTNEVA